MNNKFFYVMNGRLSDGSPNGKWSSLHIFKTSVVTNTQLTFSPSTQIRPPVISLSFILSLSLTETAVATR